MSDDISFQTWICPKCYDVHLRNGECSPLGADKFSPAPSDHSYIANEFRKLEAEIERLKAENAKMRKALEYVEKACLCERFKTKGFDYGEKHPRLEHKVGARHCSPYIYAREVIASLKENE